MPAKGEAATVEEKDPETGETVIRSAKKKVEIKQEPNKKYLQKEHEGEPRHPNAGSSSQSSKRHESKQTSKAEKRVSSSGTAAPRKPSTRPPSAHKNVKPPHVEIVRTQPINIIQDHPQLRAMTQSHGRPTSYHEGMYHYPPISHSAYYVPPQNSLIPTPSYPPPSPIASYMYANGNTYYSRGGSVLPPPSFRQDYSMPAPQLPSRTLEERLGGEERARRRSSVYYTTKGDHEDRGYDSAYERSTSFARKSSLRKTQEQLDRERMPPPPSRRRMSVQHADECSRFEDESSAGPRYRQSFAEEKSLRRSRRASMDRHSATHACGTYDRIEPERSGERRRSNRYYDVPSAPANNYEEKLRAAGDYQNSVGGPETRLTAESLKKASRRAHPPSSHSTRSSGSRDESERQRSSVTTRTTGTTRTGAGDEDITIKLKGQGKIKIAGAEIDYDEDTELNIHRSGGNGGGGGSQRSSDNGASEERRDRRDRASDRSRLSSNAKIPRDRHGYF